LLFIIPDGKIQTKIIIPLYLGKANLASGPEGTLV
jgi:hypothetical protein